MDGGRACRWRVAHRGYQSGREAVFRRRRVSRSRPTAKAGANVASRLGRRQRDDHHVPARPDRKRDTAYFETHRLYRPTPVVRGRQPRLGRSPNLVTRLLSGGRPVVKDLRPFRIATYLLVIFCALHTGGGMLAQKSLGPAADTVFAAMKAVHFDFNGSDCTWYGFWFGFGLTASVFLLFSAAV